MQHLGDQLVFGTLWASLGWSRSFLQRGAFMLFTSNGAHRLSRGYLLAIGDASTAGYYRYTKTKFATRARSHRHASNWFLDWYPDCYDGADGLDKFIPVQLSMEHQEWFGINAPLRNGFSLFEAWIELRHPYAQQEPATTRIRTIMLTVTDPMHH